MARKFEEMNKYVTVTLGDSGQTPVDSSHPLPVEVDGINLSADVTGLKGAIEEGSAIVTGSGASALATTKSWPTNQWAGYLVRVTAGTSAGDVRVIASNTATILTITGTFTATPTATTKYEIHEPFADMVTHLQETADHVHSIDASTTIMDDAFAAEGAAATKGIQISLDDGTDSQYAQCTAAGALKADITTIAGTAPSTAGKIDIKSAGGDLIDIGAADAAIVDAGAVGSVAAKLRRISTDLDNVMDSLAIMDDWDSTDRCKVINDPIRSTTVTHRNGITSVDKVISPTLVTLADNAAYVGVMANASHGAAVAAGNAWGTSGTSNILTVTPTLNKTVDLTIPQATGATYYDVFFSAAPTAPLWVCRITEAQRANGCSCTAVGTVDTVTEPIVAGKINIKLVGTGIANTNAVFAQNNAYTPATPTKIDCRGYSKAYVYVDLALTDLRIAPACSIVPFLTKNEASPTAFYQGAAQALNPLAYVGSCLSQVFEIDLDGAYWVVVLVGTLTGQGAAATVNVELV